MARVCDREIPQRTNAGIATEFRRCVRAFRDWEESKPEEVAQFIEALDEEDVAEFTKSPTTANLGCDLAFAYFRREQFPAHSALVEQILYNQRGGIREREESDRVGKLLRWRRQYSHRRESCAFRTGSNTGARDGDACRSQFFLWRTMAAKNHLHTSFDA